MPTCSNGSQGDQVQMSVVDVVNIQHSLSAGNIANIYRDWVLHSRLRPPLVFYLFIYVLLCVANTNRMHLNTLSFLCKSKKQILFVFLRWFVCFCPVSGWAHKRYFNRSPISCTFNAIIKLELNQYIQKNKLVFYQPVRAWCTETSLKLNCWLLTRHTSRYCLVLVSSFAIWLASIRIDKALLTHTTPEWICVFIVLFLFVWHGGGMME